MKITKVLAATLGLGLAVVLSGCGNTEEAPSNAATNQERNDEAGRFKNLDEQFTPSEGDTTPEDPFKDSPFVQTK